MKNESKKESNAWCNLEGFAFALILNIGLILVLALA